ncbi:sodium:proton antiporter [Microbacterium sp. NPDC076911]|uniref:cation:proton antiporter n=1 Tax=Microbacterium sp. NPDC076911 TaxID=3154958 RepID=UPI003416F36D
MEVLLIALGVVVVIALATAVAPRVRIAGPMILVAIGIGVGLLPAVDVPEVDPEWILVGVLPPLLYAAAVRLPALEFRRDFGPIAGLAFVLVILTSLALGAFFIAVIPGIDPLIAIALGAILSPTDAVATAIARRAGISRRVVTMLEGESLLNDATALVLLRTMVAAAAVATSTVADTSVSFLPAFAWGVIAAVVIGAIVGLANLRLRSKISNPPANTALAFVVPFIAYLPTEELGGSGLVAAVVAGIVTGQGAARYFSPEQRRSDEATWKTLEVMLEGGVFLLMGLELNAIIDGNFANNGGIGTGLILAGGAFFIILLMRTGYVTLLVWIQGRRATTVQRKRLAHISDRIDDIATRPESDGGLRARFDGPRSARSIASMRKRLASAMRDLDYYQATALGWKHGAVIVWAGMRGVVTLAAAQTLPRELPGRDLLIFVAFTVAVGSLAIQGLTLPWVVKLLKFPRSENTERAGRAEQEQIDDALRDAAAAAVGHASLKQRDGSPFSEAMMKSVNAKLLQPRELRSGDAHTYYELRLAILRAMRARLNELARGGHYSTEALRQALAELDADELSVQLRLESE